MSFDLLNRALVELEQAMTACGVKLIIGGGFGLFLWQNQMLAEKADIPTLIRRDIWCNQRATADFDIILETNIVASIEQFLAIREALDRLGYTVIEGVEYLHFEKSFSETERVEINFLTGPITDLSLAAKIKVSRPRVRPKGDVKLHAYLTDEAIGLTGSLTQVTIPGSRAAKVYVPSPETFLLMKLHAFRDRLLKGDQDKAGHHAMDVYRIISMLTEESFETTKSFLQANRNVDVVESASEIIRTYFTAADQMGLTKIREHPLYGPELELNLMRSVLAELLR